MALSIVACLPGVAGAESRGTGPLTATPSSVSFGPVLVKDPDCQPISSPFPGCVTAVFLVTNTSGETVRPRTQSACSTIVLDPDSCAGERGEGWGGLIVGPPENTCMADIPPGGSCQVTLLGRPDRKGVIDGFYVMGSESGRFLLIVPVQIVGSVSCSGTLSTVVGTRDDDVGLMGTGGADVIAGLRGDDVIVGDAEDVVCGGRGADRIAGAGRARGGPGDDTIDASGGGARDIADGGAGFDVCVVDPSDRHRNCEVVRFDSPS